MVKRKSFNPFKMWGSYVGAVGGILLSGYVGINCIGSCTFNLTKFLSDISFGGLGLIPIGFILGWGIHSLFRRIKK